MMRQAAGWVSVLMLGFGLLLAAAGTAAAAETARIYSVVHVAPDDKLNMRNQPGVEGSKVVASIPHNAKGILLTGETRQVGRSTWVKISWSGRQGWVNRYYLLEDVQTSNYEPGTPRRNDPGVVMECRGTEPFWSINISEKKMAIELADGPKFSVDVSFRQRSVNNTRIAVVGGRRGNALTSAFLEKVESCSDGMSERNYPYAVTAVVNSYKVVSGCCSVNEGR
ncbi:MAG TPA: hypothetical protein PLB10_05785 [Thiolinea sp.]|nr:hypothetical protein [Thiolinea sp.]